jgi:hypothetical protein
MSSCGEPVFCMTGKWANNPTVQRTGASRFAQRRIEHERRLAPVAAPRVSGSTRMGALTPSRFFVSTALIVGCLSLASCSTPKTTRSGGDSDVVQSLSCWQPQLLYLLASPHARLHVEVDAVEGCIPSEATLSRLRDFLATYCNKPEGIEIVRSDVIPIKAALGISPTALAREFLNGAPDDRPAPSAAFIYVLFYNDLLSNRPSVAETGHPGAKTATRSRSANRNPHVDLLPYPAMIYMNTRRGPKSARDLVVLHEAGHVLGLAFRPANASAGHCQDRTCLMYKTLVVHIKRLLLGQDPITQRHFCDRCVAQLVETSRQAPPSNLRFVGPVLVRSEAGYHVLSLPHRSKVIVGELADQDCRNFAAAVRAEAALPGDDDGERRVDGLSKEEVLREPEKLCAILDRAKADPYELVRRLASKWWAHAWTEQYLAGSQFTNAVDICRQAIISDPKDDWSYNQLAWIKATCSEATIRDGKEAVAAARKACELTQWKQSAWIDTLAAAYAEVGDFKRAVDFEEQALRTGPPGESDQKEIRERIAMYKQSRPFRAKP